MPFLQTLCGATASSGPSSSPASCPKISPVPSFHCTFSDTLHQDSTHLGNILRKDGFSWEQRLLPLRDSQLIAADKIGSFWMTNWMGFWFTLFTFFLRYHRLKHASLNSPQVAMKSEKKSYLNTLLSQYSILFILCMGQNSKLVLSK